MDADLFLIYFYSKHMSTYIVAQKALKVNVRQMFFFVKIKKGFKFCWHIEALRQ